MDAITRYGAIWGSLGVGVAIASLSLSPGPLRNAELASLNWRMEHFDAHPPAPHVVIVDADEGSIERMGQWPWPRRIHARLIDRLTALGARLIDFDMVFSEASDEADDAALARAIQQSGRVVLASFLSGIQTLHPDGSFGPELTVPLARFHAPHGYASLPLDPDKYVRRLPKASWHGEPSICWTVLDRWDTARAAALRPTLAGGGALLRMSGPPGSYPTVSYASVLDDVLDPRVDRAFHPADPRAVASYAELFKDSLVIIGSSAPTQHDSFPAPFASHDQRMMPGVELQANAIGTLMHGHPRREAPWPISASLTVLMPGLAAIAMRRSSPLRGMIWLLALAALTLALGLFSFAILGWALWLVPPLVAKALAAAGLLAQKLLHTEQERSRIRATFSRYVAPGVVDAILRHPDRYQLSAAHRCEVTVLFADVQGFTSLSEQLPAERVESLLNGYLSAMTTEIFRCQGTLDKYIGDGIMAVWGNLGDMPPEEAAIEACRAALGMQEAARRLSDAWIRDGLPPLVVRIGIHSGEALVGNFGSELKLDFTVIGDVVNTASRLEALNKSVGTRILISGATFGLVPNRVTAAPKGDQAVRGKTATLSVFELSGLAGTVPAAPQPERTST